MIETPNSYEELEARLTISRKTLKWMRNKDVGYWLGDHEIRPPEVVDQALAAHDLLDALADLRKQLDEAREAAHYSYGTAQLAMKHRDAAEAEVERLRKVVESDG